MKNISIQDAQEVLYYDLLKAHFDIMGRSKDDNIKGMKKDGESIVIELTNGQKVIYWVEVK